MCMRRRGATVALHTAKARLLEPGARASSRARLHAVECAYSSPQHRGHSGVCSSSRYGMGRCRRFADTMSSTAFAGLSGSDTIAIRALPGQPQGVDFDQYGGYVTVGEENGRALFYYFVEAPSGAAEKPLVLWLNGGPGCSSLGYGAMQELGPFRVSQDNKTLTRNLNAWNTERFPEYKDRAFYISRESFAGHYVPELAATILLHSTYNNRTIVNLKGVLVGNPYLDDNINIKGRVDFFWTHGVMSDEVYANVTKNCNFDSAVETPSLEAACNGALDVFHEGDIDAYNIYAPVCLEGPNGKYYPSANLLGYDPCSEFPTNAYLNDPAVQNAFHARATKWQGCS
ncbi:hypothetical protein ACQ4PT_063581 [Festuca glaucescens]